MNASTISAIGSVLIVALLALGVFIDVKDDIASAHKEIATVGGEVKAVKVEIKGLREDIQTIASKFAWAPMLDKKYKIVGSFTPTDPSIQKAVSQIFKEYDVKFLVACGGNDISCQKGVMSMKPFISPPR